MQNKGFVKLFAVALAVVCAFYLSFSFVTGHYNKKAKQYAQGDRVKEAHYLDSLAGKKVWLGYTLKEAREQEIGLGLDLKGGMNVVLELNVADVLRSLSNFNQNENFNKAIDLAYNNRGGNQKDFIDLFAEEYKRLDPGATLAGIFSTFELKEKITPQSTDAQVISVLKQELNTAIDNSFRVLRTRIDRFGVVAPNIQRLEVAGRILIELPGVKEPERVRKLLQGSANLEFWETYNLPEIYQSLANANTILASIQRKETAIQDSISSDITEKTSVNKEDVNDRKEQVEAVASDSSNNEDIVDKLKQEGKISKEEQASLDEFKKNNPLFALLQINQYNGQIATGPVVGYARSSDMATIDSLLNIKQVREALPRNLDLLWGVKSTDPDGRIYELYAIKKTNRDGKPALDGKVVTNANDDFRQVGGVTSSVVNMAMNAEGAKDWARLTKENIGRSIAIVLDQVVYSAPNVNSEITGGRSEISGHFTPEEAKDLANVLNSGKMAASVRIVQEDVVGPSLGHEAIQAGMISFIIALIFLMAYMFLCYGWKPALIINGALLVNVFFTMGILASFHAVLTLSGIAGLVLTLGMAVDANVLINERIKEELRAGKTHSRAIQDGYKAAFSAIFDSNITTIITGIVLFYYGTGPIRGFATTLIIGLISSFITAVFLTRIVYEALDAKGKMENVSFTTSAFKNVLVDTKYNFLGKRKIGYIIPGAIIVLGIIAMFTVGLNKGIDFTGGRNYIVRFEQPVKTHDVSDLLRDNLEGNLSVITIGTSNQVRISTNHKINDNNPAVDQEIENILFTSLKELTPESTTLKQFIDQNIQSSQKVGPSMADDIKNAAYLAVILSLIFMAAYILLRFRDIAFSAGAFASVSVATLCIIAFYSLLWKVMPFSLEIDQTFIAAILTIIGYSINDTVVVFDRIRETIQLYPTRDRYQTINDALNSTLSRTMNTSLTTLIVVLCIFFFGGSTIRSFTFAIIIGIIVGTYCTLFIGTPIAYEIQSRKIRRKELKVATQKK